MPGRRLALVTIAVTLLGLVGGLSAATVYIAPSSAWQISTWRFLEGPAEPPLSWREPDFDDSGWRNGKAPFGHGVGGFVRYGTARKDLHDGGTTVFLRKRFYVDDPANATSLKLSINFSDGFAAWINGIEVAAENAPAIRSAASLATRARPASGEHRYQVFAVSSAAVRRGENVLAIQLFRHARDAEVVHFDASLVDTRNLVFNRPATASAVRNNERYFQPSAANDGTQLTFWHSGPQVPDAPGWLAVDLGDIHIIDKARLHWWGGELPGLGGGARDYELQVSDDARAWTTAATLTDQNGGEDEFHFPAVSARHVRIHATAANSAGGYGLLDFEVYARGVPFDAREFDSLALHKPVTASSQAWRGAPPAKAVDNNAGSWWESSPKAEDPQWLEVDLGRPQRISGVRVYFSDRFAQRFTIQLAGTAPEWREPECRVGTEEVDAGDNHRMHRIMFASVEEARRVRVLLWDKNPRVDRYAITEFVVIGAPAEPHR